MVAKRRHAVAAVGDLFVDLVLGLKFEFALAEARNFRAVIERFALALRPVADGAILSKERCFVGFAVGDDISFGFGIKTRGDAKKRKIKMINKIKLTITQFKKMTLSSRSCFTLFLQRPLEYLSRAADRQFGTKLDVPRIFVGGKLPRHHSINSSAVSSCPCFSARQRP